MRRNNQINETLQRSWQILYYLVFECTILGKKENMYTMLRPSSILDMKCNPSHSYVQKDIGELAQRKAKRTEKNGATFVHRLRPFSLEVRWLKTVQ